MKGLLRGDDLGELLRAILSDHEGQDDAMSICGHPDLSVPLGERRHDDGEHDLGPEGALGRSVRGPALPERAAPVRLALGTVGARAPGRQPALSTRHSVGRGRCDTICGSSRPAVGAPTGTTNGSGQ